jgi:PAS domain S-box-containing protein
MQRPQRKNVTLNDILITEELSRRSPRPPNWQAQAQAMQPIARQMAQGSKTLLQTLVDLAVELCQAGSAGVSLLETTTDGEEIFRWTVLAGTLAQSVGGTTPRHFSPCGFCLDSLRAGGAERGTPVLFSYPERYFTYFQEANTPIVEGLVLPLIADDRVFGTIWILSHDEQRHFDCEDVRVMSSLADFTVAALLLEGQQTHQLLAANSRLEAEVNKRKQAEIALRESKQRSHALIENLPGGAVFVVDCNLRYLLAEGEALSAAGFKREDFVGRTIFEVLPPELGTYYEPMYRKALAGEPFEHEHHAHERTYISRGTPLYSANGEVYAALAVSYDISDRKQAEATIAANLQDTQLLCELSARLVMEGDIQTLYQEIISTAIALTRADAGSIQILDEATQELVMLANQGAGQKLTQHFYRVNADSNTPCGMALATGERTFVDFDVPESEDPHGSMRLHREEGYLSAQSTPLIARSGKAIGMVSTHWRKHHRPSDRELRFLDLLARQAADLIEQRQAQAALRESEARLALELADAKQLQFISSQLLQEENIHALYEQILDAAIAIMRSEMGSMQMLHPDSNQLQLLAWKGFDPASAAFWEWVQVDSDTTCGIALKTGERAIIPDVETWESLTGSRDLDAFRLSGIRSVQTTPLISRSGRIVGMISNHWRAPHQPSEREFGLLNVLARQAADLIEQRQAEAQLRRAAEMDAFRVKLSDALRSLSDPIQMQAEACRRLGEHLGVDRAYYVEVNEVESYARVNQDYLRGNSPTLVGTFRLADYGWIVPHLRRGETIIVTDADNTDIIPEAERAAMGVVKIASHITIPLVKAGVLVGALCVTESNPRQWLEAEVELVRETADRIWAAIERAYAEAALRQSEEKYRSLFTSIDEGYALCEVMYDENERPVDVRYLEVNPAFEQLSGLENVVGKTAMELMPIVESFWLEAIDRVVQTGVATRLEDYAEGSNRWLDIYFSRVGGEGSRQIAVVFNDITDRKRTEERLRRAAELDAFRVTLSDALRSLSDPVEIQRAAMHVLGEHLAADRVFYGEITDDGEMIVIADNYLRGDAPKLIGQLPTSAFGKASETLRAGHTFVFSDIDRDERLPDADREAIRALSIISSATVPLVKQSRWVSNLTVHYSKLHQWTDDEIQLLQETAERTWAAVERARAEAALRDSEIQRIQEQAAREEERQRAETLAELDRAKTLFFSNVSHEFRTPLTLILAPVQDALSDSVNPLPGVQRERLELVHRNTMRLLKLVNTLLDFSRIEAGRMEAVYEPTDLAMFTAELASVFRSAIEQAGLRLVVDCPPLPESVYVDREMWEKIVLNLLSNAFKFTLEGEITVRLHLADDYHVTLQVEDTGTGIEPEELPHLFERFYQVRKAKARTHEGSGIGLALVQELIKLHGGTLEVSSTIGVGSCFTVTIPLGTAHLPSDRLQLDVGDRITATRTLTSTALGAAAYVEEAERWIGEESVGSVGSVNSYLSSLSSPSHILLVDDNADMRDYLTRILSEHVEVEAVADGAAALAAVQERVPDLVLSDVMMPLLDGFELLKALRTDARTKEVPIILLSARAGEEFVIEGLQAGADDYLIKPFSAQELVTRVNAHLQMAHLRSEALHQEKTNNRRKDEFLAKVSHELNTPLVAILGWTRLLRSSPPNPAMLVKALETIERNATLQAKLIQDLLDISRIIAGKISLNHQSVDLKSIIETAIATVRPSLETKNICLEYILEPSTTVQGDPERLQQIVLNLLTNAIKFTPQGGRIKVCLDITENQAQIVVKDNGKGISAEFLPHVFDIFRQSESSHSKNGLGLGLAIARHLVELHGGTIIAESSGVGQGATFTVKLPLVGVSL